MPRPRNPTLMSAWKLYMPAPLTSRVELLLFDPLTRKPKHGERARITAMLWEEYLTKVRGYGTTDDNILIFLPELHNAIYEFQGTRLTYTDLSSLVKEHEARCLLKTPLAKPTGTSTTNHTTN